jgi:hypothetical protein
VTTNHFPAILAQSDTSQLSSTADVLFAISIPLCIFLISGFVVFVVVMKQVGRSRELLHEERLKAIDAGMNWHDPDQNEQQNKSIHNAFWISFWMVVVGCGASFSAVSSFLGDGNDHDTSVAMFAWVSAGGSSVAALASATLLMVKARAHHENVT